MQKILQVDDLRVTLGGQDILDGVTFSVDRGSIHALIGPNGAGKTTVIRSILGGMPHRGTIKCRFLDKSHIGYVPQFLEFDHALPITVADFINIALSDRPTFLGRARKMSRRIEETLAVMECAHLAKRLIGGLSGGELRRVLIALALTPMPEILLLDEPASNVDEYGTRLLENYLSELRNKHGVTILMVAHDLQSVLRLADAVTGLNRFVTFRGSPEELDDPDTLKRVFGIQQIKESDA